MIDELKGMDKDIRNVVQVALDRGGWDISTTSNGHRILRHEGGGTILVPSHRGSYRNIKNIEAGIRRVEKEAADKAEAQAEAQAEEVEPQVQAMVDEKPEWDGFVHSTGQYHERRLRADNTWEYRCPVCRKEGMASISSVAGHMRMHGPTGGTRTTTKKEEPVAPAVPKFERTVPAVPNTPAPPVAPKAKVNSGKNTLADTITALIEAEMESLTRENERLMVENTRLKEALSTLAQLAAEAG